MVAGNRSKPAKSMTRATSHTSDPATKPRRFVFVLVNEFTLLSFAGAIDALRIANRQTPSPIYEWVLCGEGGDTVA